LIRSVDYDERKPVAAAALPDGNQKKLKEDLSPKPTPKPTLPAVRSNFPETWLWADTNVKLRLKHAKFVCPSELCKFF
jgi:hypothetical protein